MKKGLHQNLFQETFVCAHILLFTESVLANIARGSVQTWNVSLGTILQAFSWKFLSNSIFLNNIRILWNLLLVIHTHAFHCVSFTVLKREITNKELVLVGDFNINFLDFNESKMVQSFVNLMFRHGLISTVNKPTR